MVGLKSLVLVSEAQIWAKCSHVSSCTPW